MTDINETIEHLKIGTNIDKIVNKVLSLEDRLRRFELLFDGLQGVENITSSLQILDERTAKLEEDFSTLDDKVADTESRLDSLEESASEDGITDKIRDTLNGARITIDI